VKLGDVLGLIRQPEADEVRRTATIALSYVLDEFNVDTSVLDPWQARARHWPVSLEERGQYGTESNIMNTVRRKLGRLSTIRSKATWFRRPVRSGIVFSALLEILMQEQTEDASKIDLANLRVSA
jgi:hypothetical protein